MLFEGSCGCEAVRFRVHAVTPYPYLRGYGQKGRKLAGSGGFTAFLFADAETLEIRGEDAIAVHCWAGAEGGEAFNEHHFCGRCGSPLWQYDRRYSDHLHPYASAVDSPLPRPPVVNAFDLAERAPWVPLPTGEDVIAEDGPYTIGMLDWHRQHGWISD